MSEPQAQSAATEGRFNWFSGVFTPSILTVLGVVMYLRLGWTTGQAGLGMMLIIVLITHLITGATALSVSSIATNRTVGTGGAYFMISRSLGAVGRLRRWNPAFLGASAQRHLLCCRFRRSGPPVTIPGSRRS